MSKDDNMEVDMVAETENFAVWRSPDEEGFIYHVELGSITLHLASDEWEEFLELMSDANDKS
ncbi:MAG: hypothetical protein H6654_12755 [Ardenticatenaceae bacterium]|nr:hypothetical protein [Anaerolineales bacterium]MCB8941683.1 hypothetical protein [Ardenticatenaceae bacterium]MCB8974422.1 hypothetical protein [Ardenticatenaceae bacterium]